MVRKQPVLKPYKLFQLNLPAQSQTTVYMAYFKDYNGVKGVKWLS